MAQRRADDRSPVSGIEPTIGVPLLPKEASLSTVDPAFYTRGAEIARGGMGRIIEATDRRLGRTIALKELLVAASEGSGGDADLAARFEREALITARLQHPSIVAIYEAGRWPSGDVFYAMKRVSGRSFDKVIADTDTLRARLALLPNLLAIFDAIAYAHGQRIIHRDLKPANVLVGAHGETVVIDWGLAKDLDDGSPEGPGSSLAQQGARDNHGSPAGPGETVSGAVMGTPAYMAPEQARGERVDQRADVYALGAMLYHALSGRQPYGTTTAEATLKAVLAGPPQPLAEAEPDVPEDLAAIVDKAMASDRAERYPSANELAQDLRRYQTGQLVGAHAYSLKDLVMRWLRRHKATVTVAAVILVLAGAALVIAFKNVVSARDRASAESERATAESERATAEGERARARADELVLRRARDLLTTDPTAALAWLAQYPATGPARDEAALIAAEASSLGIARHVLVHKRDVRDVAISPDAKWIASASADGEVKLWDATTGKGQTLLHGDVAALRVQFASVGGLLVATTLDGKLHVWNTTADRTHELATLTAGTDAIRALDWTADGTRLAAAGNDRRVRVWAAPSFTEVSAYEVTDDVFAIAFAPDDKSLAVIGRMAEVITWQLSDGSARKFGPMKDGALSVRYSPDGKRLAVASRDGKTYLWDPATGTPITKQPLDDHRLVRTIAFSPDGTQLATGGEGNDIHVWNIETGAHATLSGHTGAVIDLAYASADQLISASLDHTLAIWNPATGARRPLIGHHDMINRFTLSRDGSLIASAGKDHAVRVWPVRDTAVAVGLGDPDHVANDLAFAPSAPGRRPQIAIAFDQGRITEWTEREPPKPEITDDGCKAPGAPRHLEYSPDGTHLAWTGGSVNAHVCTITGAIANVRDLAHDREAFALAWTPSGQLLTGSIDKTVRLWNVDTGTSKTLYTHAGGVWTVAVSPDGTHFASAGFDKTVAIGRIDGTTPVRVRTGHRDGVNEVVFSRDGKTLASVSDDETARVWSVAGDDVTTYDLQRTANTLAIAPDGALITGTHDGRVRLWRPGGGANHPPQMLARHRGAVASVAVSPDGRYVASGGQDGNVWLADLSRGTAIVHVTPGAIRRVAFAPDGKRLAVAGKQLYVWHLDTAALAGEHTTAVVRDDGEIATP